MTDTDRIDELLRTSVRIETKLDALDGKLDRHAEKLAEHEVRITMVEQTGQRQWERMALWIGVAVSLGSTVIETWVR